MQLEITTFGNGPLITGVLQGIANITTSSDYQVLLMTILGLAIVLGVYGYHKDLISLGSGAHHTWMSKAAGAFAIYWLLSAGSINVFIYDPLNTYTGVADNVPIGIAMPYYLQNQISENLSTLYGEWLAPSGYASEFSYDNPNNGAGFYNPGMASPLQAINEAMKANPPDMYFQETMTGFGKDCMVPALLLGVVNPNDLYASSDIEDLISTDMPNLPQAWTTEIYSSSSPGGTTYPCSQAWTGFIKPDIDNFSGQSSGSNGSLNNVFADKFNTATNSSQNALADTLLLGNAASYMFNLSITGQQMLAQAAMMNSIGKGIMQFSESTGTSSTAQGYALTQAMSQSQSSWTTSAIMASKMLPIFHLIMEVIVIALFPLFFALAVIPTMTGKYLKLLFELLMWLAMWSPIASILNYAVNSYIQAKVFVNISNPLSGTAGFNLANYNFIAQNSYIYTAVTGAMMWMIPVLSFGLVTGSAYVISGAISAAQGTAHGAAQQQGASVGTSSGLQGIGSQAGSLAGMQSEEKQGYNPAAAAEKIAGMGALDNLSNASAFGNNLQTNGLNNMIKAKTSNQEQSIASGIVTAAQAQQIGTQQGQRSIGNTDANQALANEYFGGNTQKLFNFESAISANKELAGDVGSAKAFEQAKADGFKGNYQQYLQFAFTIGDESKFGAAVGKNQAYNGNVTAGETFTARENTIKGFLGAQAFSDIAAKYGTGWIKNGTEFNEVERLASGNYLGQNAALVGETGAASKLGQAEGYGSPQNAQYAARVSAVESYVAAKTVGLKNAAFAGYAKGVNQMNDVFKSYLTSPAGSAEHAELGQISNEFLNNSNPMIRNMARTLFAGDAATYMTDQTSNKGDMSLSKSASTSKGSKSATQITVKAGVNASADLSWKPVAGTVGAITGGILGSLFAAGSDVATEGVGAVGNAAEVGGGIALGRMIGGDIGGFIQHTWDNYTGSDRKNTATDSNSLTTSTGNTTAEAIVQKINNYNGNDPSGFVYGQVQKNSSPNTVTEPTRPAMPSPVGKHTTELTSGSGGNNPSGYFVPTPGVQSGPGQYTTVNGELVQPGQLPGSPANLGLPGPSAGTPQVTGATGLGATGDDGIIVEP